MPANAPTSNYDALADLDFSGGNSGTASAMPAITGLPQLPNENATAPPDSFDAVFGSMPQSSNQNAAPSQGAPSQNLLDL